MSLLRDFCSGASQVQLNVSCGIKLFAGFINFIDMNSRTMHTEALFGSSYSVDKASFYKQPGTRR